MESSNPTNKSSSTTQQLSIQPSPNSLKIEVVAESLVKPGDDKIIKVDPTKL